MVRQSRREREIAEQAKAAAHRHGIGAYKAGLPRNANPHLGMLGKEQESHAWDRAWAAEQTLFGKAPK